jgi:hypothetical protein
MRQIQNVLIFSLARFKTLLHSLTSSHTRRTAVRLNIISLRAKACRPAKSLREVTEPLRHLAKSFREVTKPLRHLAESFREVTKPLCHLAKSFREVTKPLCQLIKPFPPIKGRGEYAAAPVGGWGVISRESLINLKHKHL